MNKKRKGEGRIYMGIRTLDDINKEKSKRELIWLITRYIMLKHDPPIPADGFRGFFQAIIDFMGDDNLKKMRERWKEKGLPSKISKEEIDDLLKRMKEDN